MTDDRIIADLAAPAPRSGSPRSWPLSWHLVALVIAAFGPAMALCGWLLSRHIAEAQREIERDATARVEMWAGAVDQVLSGSIGTLRALAASAALRGRNYAAFAEQAGASFGATGVTVQVRDGRLALQGAAPGKIDAAPEAPALLSPEEIQQVFNSPQPIVTGWRDAAGGSPAGVDVWIRAGPSRAEAVLLQARLPSEYLSLSFAPSSLKTPWTVALTDHDRRIVARSDRLKAELGSVLAEPALAAGGASESSSGVIKRATGPSGAAELLATAAATVPNWRVVAIAPRAQIEARLDQHWQGFMLVAALLGSVMAGATSYVAAAISRSVSTVAANARSLASGAPMARVDTTITEVRELMDTICGTRDELIRRKAALRDSDHRLRMALDAGGMGVWEWDRVTDEMTWDPVEFDLAGLPRGERAPKGQEFVARVLPEDRAILTEALAGLTLEDPAFAVDFRFRRFDGEVRWLASRGLLMAGADGDPRGLVGVNYDTSEQRANTDRTAALLREVSHRSKNMLALILAMARLTARDATDVQSHVKQFSARVAGLASSQDLIVAADWKTVDLAALAAAEAKAIAHDGAERVTVQGPSIALLPEAAQTLGMVFAELTLNAIQHGALTTARGRVDLSWEIDGGNMTMTWIESNGPPVSGCDRRGYGMSVVERFAEQGLKATARVNPKPEGLIWRLSAPLENLGMAIEGPV